MQLLRLATELERLQYLSFLAISLTFESRDYYNAQLKCAGIIGTRNIRLRDVKFYFSPDFMIIREADGRISSIVPHNGKYFHQTFDASTPRTD